MAEKYFHTHISSELVQVAVEDLRVGMYVSKLDRPWLESSFLFQGFEIRNDDDIAAVKAQCNYVYVDVSREIKVPVIFSRNTAYSKATLNKIPPPSKRSSFAKEIKHAEYVHNKTSTIVKSFMQEVQLGRPISVEVAKQAVAECVDSVINSPDALLLMGQLKNKDEYTAQHSMNVCIYSIALGRHLNLSIEELKNLGLCGMMHDMGKMFVPLEVLNKPGKLTPEELTLMQSHATRGWKLLLSTPNMAGNAIDVAYTHHERLDGTGYPRQLKDEQLSFFTRIVAISDTYDAISSDRVYQKGRTHLEAIKILNDISGTHLDSTLTIRFIECIGIYPAGCIVEMSNGEVALVLEINRRAKIRPKVLLLLDEDKKPRKERIIDLTKIDLDASGQRYAVRNVVRPETYGINLLDYYNRGILMQKFTESG
ncbi:MAG: HD-GYP domain-containing protein [Methylococcaceae bacterium]|jgi:HD-GYP domain-containing protein (c-di-GMP phosphodiesterase class II)